MAATYFLLPAAVCAVTVLELARDCNGQLVTPRDEPPMWSEGRAKNCSAAKQKTW